jgi:hypothetical protein
LGAHSERITVRGSTVEDFQYSNELKAIRIMSKPVIRVETEKGSEIIDYASKEPYELVLYPQGYNVESLIPAFEKCFGKSIEHMDDMAVESAVSGADDADDADDADIEDDADGADDMDDEDGADDGQSS